MLTCLPTCTKLWSVSHKLEIETMCLQSKSFLKNISAPRDNFYFESEHSVSSLCSTFRYHLVISWWMFADKSALSVATSALRAANPMTKRFLVEHILVCDCQQPLANQFSPHRRFPRGRRPVWACVADVLSSTRIPEVFQEVPRDRFQGWDSKSQSPQTHSWTSLNIISG